VAQEQMPVRILLADEHSLFREAVRLVLESQPDLTVVGEAGDSSQAEREAARSLPDVALLDLDLTGRGTLRATAQIVEGIPGCRVLILVDQEDPGTLVEALEAGATGYLSKNCPLSELIHAVRAIHRGETLVPPRMLGPLLHRLIHRRRERQDALRLTARLTRREREVLALLTEGCDNDAIAQALVISPETARTHVQNVLSKLGVHSRLEAAAFVTRTGIVDDLGVGVDG
jgi:DNA-binding NarL/FixJ family response regulator